MKTIIFDLGETLVDETRQWEVVANQPDGIVEQLNAMNLQLDVIASSATYGVAKPDPHFFERIVADGGVPASDIVYVGDRLDNDILPAQSIGMHAVFIRRGPWGYVHAHWPEMDQVRYRIDSLSELSAVIQQVERAG